MALVFMDGFTHYGTSQFELKWQTLGAGASITAAGRFGGNCLRESGGSSTNISKTLTPSGNTAIIGLGWRTSVLTATASIWEFGGTHLRMVSDGRLRFTTSGGATLATSTLMMSTNVYYHLEAKVFYNASTGTVQLRVDGVDWIASTGSLNTGAIGSQLVMRQIDGTTDRSDVYILDGSGSAPLNDLIGDCKIETIRPSGNGNSSQWLGSDGNSTDNYLLVDESTPNGDTDYVSDGTVNDIDTYATGNLATTGGTVFAVQTCLYARKDDAGTRQIAPVIRQGGTDYVGATVALSSSYAYYFEKYPLDPAGGAWTISNVNADEYGVKVIA